MNICIYIYVHNDDKPIGSMYGIFTSVHLVDFSGICLGNCSIKDEYISSHHVLSQSPLLMIGPVTFPKDHVLRCCQNLVSWCPSLFAPRKCNRFDQAAHLPVSVLCVFPGGVQPSQFQVQILKHWNIWSAYLSLKKIRHRWKVSSKKRPELGGRWPSF